MATGLESSTSVSPLWVCVPVHSAAAVMASWVRDYVVFRPALEARFKSLGERLDASRHLWPGLGRIYADVWASHEALIDPKDLRLHMKGTEFLVGFSVDARRIQELDAAVRPVAIEIGVLQAVVSAATRYGMHRDLFVELLAQRMAEAGASDPTELGLPPRLTDEQVRRESKRKPRVKPAPKLIRIRPDDYHARYVGKTASGQQFFVTNPFVPAVNGNPGREFHAVYLFDAAGALVEARIDDLGTRAGLEEDTIARVRDRRLDELGKRKAATIRVAPFSITRFDTTFGLVPQEPDFEDDEWSVIVEPGDYMCFYPPWDGDYDT